MTPAKDSTVREISGKLTAEGLRFAIVVSRFNEFITSRLESAAIDTLIRHGCAEDAIAVVHVPGAFELPLVAKRLAESGKYDAVICLGCVIRGETPHFDYVAGEAVKGIAQVGMASGVPTILGVITADTLEQAINRAGGKAGNKGAEAAEDGIEMARVMKLI